LPRTLYLIDGHSQIYRAYYAPFASLSAPSGEPTRATHVFWQMVLNLVRDRKPDYLAMALDVSDATVFRTAVYPQYKAHRDPAPEDLPPQIERIVTMAQDLGVPLLRVPTFEADDIMATLARRHAGPDLHVYLVSRDKDLDQLLSPHVSLFDPLRNEVITAEGLYALKGWRPEQAVEAQILIGDSVDNVPGVAGIGPKTAARLLQKYGSATGVIEHAAELPPRQRDSVLTFAPNVETARRLVTLRDDVPLDFSLEQADVRRLRWGALRRNMVELGFRRLIDQVPAEASAGAAQGASGTATSQAPSSEARTISGEPSADELPPSLPERLASEAPETPKPDRAAVAAVAPPRHELAPRARALARPEGTTFHVVDTPEALERFAAELAREPAFSIDTETTGVNPIDAEPIGLSFSWQPGVGYYIPLRSAFGSMLPAPVVAEHLGPILANEETEKVGHHLKYDLIVLRLAGMPVSGPLFDTMIATFVLDPLQTSFKLDSVVARRLGHTIIPITDLIGTGRDQITIDQAPVAHVAEYACEDADYTWRLRELLRSELSGSDLAPLFYETEMPLLRVLMEMEYHGVRIDVDYLRGMGREFSQRAADLAQRVHELAGGSFNLDSPKQLAEVLFDRLGFRVVRNTRTTRSTDADTLEVLSRETAHPMLKLLLEYREIQKLRGTYVEALPAAVSRRTGRIHTSYHQTGAVTGRLSSSEPNLQNIPIRTELGRRIRRAFVPRTPADRLIVADYSQVELRILAHFCEDEELTRAFLEDRDIHTFVAAQIHNVPLEQVTREMRGRAKAVNFGLIYGQSAFGLGQATGMGRGEAQQFIDAYFRRYPRIRGFIDQCIEQARRLGFVRTLLGRRRPIPDIDSRNRAARALAERLAVNTVVQGSAADLIKVAMVQLQQRIERERLPLWLLLQVHDELVCEAPRENADDMSAVVAEVMSGAMALRVPLRVDARPAENWLEAK
jgi:DNA polymerase-1